MRGLDSGGTMPHAGRDPDGATRVVGSVQSDLVGGHTHPINDPGHRHHLWDNFGLSWEWNSNGAWGSHDFIQPGSWDSATATTGITVDSNGGAETRPINAAVNYIIKY
jgi:hypothetical protein